MEVKFCPSCGDILQQVEMTIGGTTAWYWVCPEGDWEEPVNSVSAEETAPEEEN